MADCTAARPPGADHVECRLRLGSAKEAPVRYVVSAMLVVVAIIHFLPLPGVLGSQRLAALYGLDFAEPNLATQLRPLLWQRMLTVAKNTGLLRLWTLPTAHFYREQGFTDVDAALKAKVPEEFGNPGADWISLKLKDDAVISAEREFEIFAMAQREESERMMSQAKSLRLFAYGLLFLTLIGIGALAFVYSRIRKRR